MADSWPEARSQRPVASYQLATTFDPGLAGQDATANLLLDYGPGQTKVFRSRGLMQEPIEVSRSVFAAIGTFVWEGIRHILEGTDHVLFVLCLVLSLILCWPIWLYSNAFVFADTRSYLSGGQTIWQMLLGMLPDIALGS